MQMNEHILDGFLDELEGISKEAVSMNWVADKVKGPTRKAILESIEGAPASMRRQVTPASVKKRMGGYPFSKKTGITAKEREGVRRNIKELREGST